jgi:hypothetical protein
VCRGSFHNTCKFFHAAQKRIKKGRGQTDLSKCIELSSVSGFPA